LEAADLFIGYLYLKYQEKELQEENKELQLQLSKIKNGSYSSYSDDDKMKSQAKRLRKKKHEIERNFRCTVNGCNKSYGSENSLNQHIKLKHKEFWVNLRNRELNFANPETLYFDKQDHV
jgi:regulator of replication initiation timing